MVEAKCPKDNVPAPGRFALLKHPPWMFRPLASGAITSSCPHCGGLLFEAESEQHFLQGAIEHEADGHPVPSASAWFELNNQTLGSLDRRRLIKGVMRDGVGVVVLTTGGIKALRAWVVPPPKMRGRPELSLVEPSRARTKQARTSASLP